MSFFSRKTLILLVLGGLLGVAAMLTAEQAHELSSTEAFCATTCHSMQTHVAGREAYTASAHRTAWAGVQPTCADCHIPEGLISATWAHVKGGVKDVWVELTEDVEGSEAWEARRARLAHSVRDWLVETDSGTCRRCHHEEAIEPGFRRGRREHRKARHEGITCIACHYNLVHEPVEPREALLRLARRTPKTPY